MNKNSRKRELLRFIVCGLCSALTDYLASQAIIYLVNDNMDEVGLTILSTAIGFIFGVIINYLLSTFWVYQNVDKDIKTKSPKFIVLFVFLSLIAMFLSIGTMLLCDLVVTKGIGLNSIVDLSLFDLFKSEGILFIAQSIFWAYAISFVLKTLVGLVWNYFTRKYILYKEPKVKC